MKGDSASDVNVDSSTRSVEQSARAAAGEQYSHLSLLALLVRFVRSWLTKKLKAMEADYSAVSGEFHHSLELVGKSIDEDSIRYLGLPWRTDAKVVLEFRLKKTSAPSDAGANPHLGEGQRDTTQRPIANSGLSGPPKRPLKVFISYARKDHRHKDKLVSHFSALRREFGVEIWHDRMIMPGEKFAAVIDARIHEADLVLLLVSSHFMESNYCYDIEFKTAQTREVAGGCIIVPIYVRECDHVGLPFEDTSWLPFDSRFAAITPVTSPVWRGHDNAWANVVAGIRKRLEVSGKA